MRRIFHRDVNDNAHLHGFYLFVCCFFLLGFPLHFGSFIWIYFHPMWMKMAGMRECNIAFIWSIKSFKYIFHWLSIRRIVIGFNGNFLVDCIGQILFICVCIPFFLCHFCPDWYVCTSFGTQHTHWIRDILNKQMSIKINRLQLLYYLSPKHCVHFAARHSKNCERFISQGEIGQFRWFQLIGM